MKFKNLIIAGSIALLPVAASAANLYIPAAGTGPGANFSQWETEVTFHNPTAAPIAITLVFHDQAGSAETAGVVVPARGTITIEDVVHTKFGRESATGAIEIVAPQQVSSNRLIVTSRTKNVTSEGEFGQNVPALSADEAVGEGDLAVLAGPSNAATSRFNVGIYAVSASTVRWELIRADGTVAGTVERQYEAGVQRQYSYFVPTFFNATPADNDVIHATVLTGNALFYGAAINERSGDPSFVPGIRIRAESGVRFAGIDLDEDGSIDIADSNNDGVLDAPVDAFIGLFPNYFRVVAESETNSALTYQIISATTDALLVDNVGTIQIYPSVSLRGTDGEIKVRVNADGLSQVLTIPVRFR